jgi:hypothetical protein
MLQWKAKYGVSDKAFEGMLKIMNDKLPENNELLSTTNEAKQTVCPLGLEVQKIHACPNDCILYRGTEPGTKEGNFSLLTLPREITL